MKKHQRIVLAIAVALGASSAFAAGGLDAGTTAITDFKTWIYTVLAVAAVVYMLIQCTNAWGNKIGWIDVLHSAGWVALAGSIPALVTFLWGIWG